MDVNVDVFESVLPNIETRASYRKDRTLWESLMPKECEQWL